MSTALKILLVLKLTLLTYSFVFGQFSIANYNTENAALPSNYIASVTIDKENVAWFGGTEYEEGQGGIFRFDGDEWHFTELAEDTTWPGINHVFDILFAANNDMWVVSYGIDSRITKVNNEGQEDFTPGQIFGSYGMSYGQSIWFVDWWTGLYEYNYDSLKWIFHNNLPLDLTNSPITSFDVDSTGIYWVGIGNKNLYKYKDTIIEKIDIFPEYPPEYKTYHYINSTAFDHDGTIWFATSEGLVHWFGPDTFTIYTPQNSNLPGKNLGQVLIDSKNNLWVSIYDFGLAVKPHGADEFILLSGANPNIGVSDIRDMEEDKEGNIWIATWGNGVCRIGLTTNVNNPASKYTSLTLFPNPVTSHGTLTVCVDNLQEQMQFDIYASDGSLVDKFFPVTIHGVCTLEMNGLSPGVYQIIAKSNTGNEHFGKFVIVR